MASPVPVKSQPLHNFSLPQLKWRKNHTNNLHRGGRRLIESPSRQSPPRRYQSSPQRHQSPVLYSAPKQSSIRECGSKPEPFFSDRHKNSASGGIKSSVSLSASDSLNEKLEKEGKSKIYIRLGKRKVGESVQDQESLPRKDEINQEQGVGVENHEIEEYVEPKTWNLRPRKPLRKPSNENNGGTRMQDSRAQLMQVGPKLDAKNREEKKDKKLKFSISLSREEIDDDIFKMTGSKPSRKPKKRAKTVQKQLDNLFPGMWLSSITPDCYKVPEAPIKG